MSKRAPVNAVAAPTAREQQAAAKWHHDRGPSAERAPCLCDEIDPSDVPCMVCTCSEELGIGPPPGAKKWPL